MTEQCPAAGSSPAQHCSVRLTASKAKARQLERRSLRLSFASLAVALVCAAVLWLVVDSKSLAYPWLAGPVLLFGVLVLHHRRVERGNALALMLAIGLLEPDETAQH